MSFFNRNSKGNYPIQYSDRTFNLEAPLSFDRFGVGGYYSEFEVDGASISSINLQTSYRINFARGQLFAGIGGRAVGEDVARLDVLPRGALRVVPGDHRL